MVRRHYPITMTQANQIDHDLRKFGDKDANQHKQHIASTRVENRNDSTIPTREDAPRQRADGRSTGGGQADVRGNSGRRNTGVDSRPSLQTAIHERRRDVGASDNSDHSSSDPTLDSKKTLRGGANGDDDSNSMRRVGGRADGLQYLGIPKEKLDPDEIRIQTCNNSWEVAKETEAMVEEVFRTKVDLSGSLIPPDREA